MNERQSFKNSVDNQDANRGGGTPNTELNQSHEASVGSDVGERSIDRGGARDNGSVEGQPPRDGQSRTESQDESREAPTRGQLAEDVLANEPGGIELGRS